MARGTRTARVASEVEDVCRTARDGDELLADVDEVLREAIGYEGASWFGTDPATLLSTAPVLIEGIEAGHCDTFWRREFLVDDAILFRDLARGPSPVGSLRAVTDDRPVRSARWREFLAPQGYDDELRAVFKVGDNTWGITALYRAAGRAPFTEDERAVVGSITSVVANALRRLITEPTPWTATPNAPGLLLFDGSDALISSNAEAVSWLNDMAPGNVVLSQNRTWVPAQRAPDPAPAFPSALVSLVARARAVADGHEPGPARLRVRSRSGQWLALHASCLDRPQAASASGSAVAVVIEPAKSADIAPIIVEAYALSPRERDVVRLIARGLSSADIAGELFLSPHTVRDYVKSVFEKLGVSSRGELVAKLFAEHYAPALHHPEPSPR